MYCNPLLFMRLKQNELMALFEKNKALAARNPAFPAAGAVTASVKKKSPFDTLKDAATFLESTDVARLNKTERDYWTHLKLNQQGGQPAVMWIGVQCITLKLADDTRYTPDFWTWEGGRIVAHEVKGFWRDDAKVKIKVAARLFPWIVFLVVKRENFSWSKEMVNS